MSSIVMYFAILRLNFLASKPKKSYILPVLFTTQYPAKVSITLEHLKREFHDYNLLSAFSSKCTIISTEH